VKKLVEAGLTIKDACFALGISRSRYYELLSKSSDGNSEIKQINKNKKEKLSQNNKEILQKIKDIKTEHPLWGYRRVTAWLRLRERMKVNRKRIYKLMKENGLLVERKIYKVRRKPKKSKPRAKKPLQFWGIDMTKFIIEGLGWVYIVIVLDWFTKEIVGFDISLRSRSEDWLRALEMALNKKFPDGVRGNGLSLISDNGSQPTSRSFMAKMTILGIEQIFTSYDNPKGNAETERMIRTIKEEVVWLHEFESLAEAKKIIGSWIEKYNREYVHSALGYLSPLEFERKFYQNYYHEAA